MFSVVSVRCGAVLGVSTLGANFIPYNLHDWFMWYKRELLVFVFFLSFLLCGLQMSMFLVNYDLLKII